MNRDLALRDGDRGWQVGPHLGTPPAAQVHHAPVIDFARIIRLISDWRWLILAAVGVGLILAVLATLLTTPLYRARVLLEVNPPRVEIMNDKNQEGSADVSSWDFIATQVGLLKSQALTWM